MLKQVLSKLPKENYKKELKSALGEKKKSKDFEESIFASPHRLDLDFKGEEFSKNTRKPLKGGKRTGKNIFKSLKNMVKKTYKSSKFLKMKIPKKTNRNVKKNKKSKKM